MIVEVFVAVNGKSGNTARNDVGVIHIFRLAGIAHAVHYQRSGVGNGDVVDGADFVLVGEIVGTGFHIECAPFAIVFVLLHGAGGHIECARSGDTGQHPRFRGCRLRIIEHNFSELLVALQRIIAKVGDR